MPAEKPRVVITMNVIRLKEYLSDHYKTNAGSWNILLTRLKPGSVCSYSNHLSSRPVGQTMQRSLKLKLKNAINQAFADTGSPAIFVGGRRRNRKKRKSKNGQNKKKAKKNVVLDTPPSSKRPVARYYEDVVLNLDEPKVSCLDIKEPVFADHPTKSRLKDAERDSMYNSSDSLSSYMSERSVFNERESGPQITELPDNESNKVGLPRLHSHDSGIFDDDNEDDGGFCDEMTTDCDEVNAEELSAQEDLSELSIDDDDLEEESKTLPLAIVNERELGDVFGTTDNTEEEVTETCPSTDVIDEFETAVLEEVKAETTLGEDGDDDLGDTGPAVLQLDDEDDSSDAIEVKELHGLEEADPFLKFVNNPDDDEEIVFDLSQLEVNNLDEISKTKETNIFQQLNEDQEVPTELEEEIPLTVPLDLLIDDDDDEVLFEAGNRKELSITCNPLYDYTVKEEEDGLSIKSYQSGFKTNFDNVNFIQIPVPASDETAQKSLRESTPLIKRQTICGDRGDELACCVIL